MYVQPNYASLRLLKDAVEAGDLVEAFTPEPEGGQSAPDGVITVEGPHFYSRSSSWYAQVMVKSGRVMKVIS